MLIEPFILRRTKTEVLTELPEKTISVLYNEMQGEQSNIYMSYMANAKREISRELVENGLEKNQIKNISTTYEAKTNMLSSITFLIKL